MKRAYGVFDQMFNGNFAGEFSVGVASHVFEQPMPVLIGGGRLRTRRLVVRVRIELEELLRLKFQYDIQFVSTV